MPARDTHGSVYIIGTKSVDIRCGLWYYNSAPREWQHRKKLQKKFEKSVDNQPQVWYNKDVKRDRENGRLSYGLSAVCAKATKE